MTDREKAIVMAYTGVAMLVGDKLDIFYQYLAELFDRPVYTHELATQKMTDKIKEKSKPDFIKLCRETTEPIKHGRWEYVSLDGCKKYKVICPFCKCEYIDNYDGYIDAEIFNYCPNCSAKMDEVIDNG